MARRNRFFRRMVVATLGSAALIGVVAGGYKAMSHAGRHVLASDAATAAVPGPDKPAHKARAAVTGDVSVATKPTPLNQLPAIKAPAVQSPIPSAIVPAVLFDRPATTRPSAMAFAITPSTRPAAVAPSAPVVTAKAAVKTGPADAAALFADSDAKLAAGDELAARNLLADALNTKTFSPTDEDAALARLQKINDTVVFSPRKFTNDRGQIAYQVAPGDNMQRIANKFDTTVGMIQRLNNISDPRRLRLGQSIKILRGPIHAAVNKTAFTLDLYQGQPGTEGAVFLKRLRVGLGENDSTPTGLWKIGDKLTHPTYYSTRDTGPRVVNADDPKNPLGAYYLALVGLSGKAVGSESYAIHGTIDPDSIGQKKSLGCIRLLNDDVALVYDMLVKEKSTVLVTE